MKPCYSLHNQLIVSLKNQDVSLLFSSGSFICSVSSGHAVDAAVSVHVLVIIGQHWSTIWSKCYLTTLTGDVEATRRTIRVSAKLETPEGTV